MSVRLFASQLTPARFILLPACSGFALPGLGGEGPGLRNLVTSTHPSKRETLIIATFAKPSSFLYADMAPP